ncbi:golgin subfamily A member 6-like protein 4 [Camellia sinensis]|uniref:golgin subfamily A member 6-like protein 4 n=1 Tax=Camellia sinensis TaxID=4442 RepID=UPI0010369F2F|nr:golgin subfamily A member 6-like protein 4 [Camellia sinensis]
MLPYNHTSGSRSFPIAMSLMANEDGDIDFPEFYKKAHKSKKTGDWIDPKCGELHDDMVNLQVTATATGLPLTHEEISRQVLGEKKNYLRGCGVGPQPSSTASSAARARDKHMELMRAKLEVLREQRQSDHEELLKEKEERQRDREELLKEKEERQRDREELLKEKEERQRDREELLKEKEARERDREEITRERKQLIKQVDEEKKAREAQQLQLNHLNDVVSRLTTLLPGSDGHPTIR